MFFILKASAEKWTCGIKARPLALLRIWWSASRKHKVACNYDWFHTETASLEREDLFIPAKVIVQTKSERILSDRGCCCGLVYFVLHWPDGSLPSGLHHDYTGIALSFFFVFPLPFPDCGVSFKRTNHTKTQMWPVEEPLYTCKAAWNGLPVMQIACCVCSVDLYISHCFCYIPFSSHHLSSPFTLRINT